MLPDRIVIRSLIILRYQILTFVNNDDHSLKFLLRNKFSLYFSYIDITCVCSLLVIVMKMLLRGYCYIYCYC